MKRAFILLAVATVIYFACFYKKPFSLEGEWIGKEIILDGQKINVSSEKGNGFEIIFEDDTDPLVKINDWSDSLYIIGRSYKMKSKIRLHYNRNGKSYVDLASRVKGLNGRFNLVIDTFQKYPNQPKRFRVNVILKSKTSYLKLARYVYPSPPKPAPFPQKGRP